MSANQPPDKKAALEGVSRVALQALSVLAPKGQGPGVFRRPLQSYLDQMYHASLDAHPGRLIDVVRDMRRARITIPQIAETYVPNVARRLGEDWHNDVLAFAAVSIGSSRLQSLLRRLEADWDQTHDNLQVSPPAFLVGVPCGEQHTLGASVLAGQLRHRGLSVHLDLELTPAQLAEQVAKEHYLGVLISVSGAEYLELTRDLVKAAQEQSRRTPVILGGTILQHNDSIQAYTKADFVTSDVHEAIRYCDVRDVANATTVDFADHLRTGTSLGVERRSAAE